MARKDAFEERLARLRKYEEDPHSAESIREFRKTLRGANHALAAKAAQIVAGHHAGEHAVKTAAEAAASEMMTT